jgi:hypothetical protein
LQDKIIGAPKKFKNQPRPLVRPSSVNCCQIFENLSHETVNLKNYKFAGKDLDKRKRKTNLTRKPIRSN